MFTDRQIEELIQGIYEGTISIFSLPQNLFSATYLQLMDGVQKGFGVFEFESPAHDVVKKLANNISTFSGAKTFEQTYFMQRLTFDNEGFKKPFKVYQKEVLPVFENYNVKYLEAEYNTATSSAFSAADWVEYEKDKETFPLLQYKTVHDGRVRDDHAKLHNIIKPVDDPFWDTFMPCNGWNCRCRVIKLSEFEGEETQLTDKKLDELIEGIPDDFRFNPGKRGKIFSEKHPYFNANKYPRETRKYFVRERETNFGFVTPPIKGIDIPEVIEAPEVEITKVDIPKVKEPKVKEPKVRKPKVYTDLNKAKDAAWKWNQSLTIGERRVLRQYTEYGDVLMNNYMRGTLKEGAFETTLYDIEGNMYNIDSSMAHDMVLNIAGKLTKQTKKLLDASPKYMTTVYRGVKATGALGDKLKSLKVGDILSDKGFLSTSYDINVAKRFTGISNDESALFTIENAVGTPMEDFSNYRTEREVLLNLETNLVLVEPPTIIKGITHYKFKML